ncbi:unnamed protein product, partial [Mesorhabditis spiculigera]
MQQIFCPSADELKALCDSVMLRFKAEKGVARPKGRTMVVGDINGNINDLWRAIHAWLSDVVDKGPGQNIIFLGNIVGPSRRQFECLILVLAYKTLFPNQVWMLRGSHEEVPLNKDPKEDKNTTCYDTFYSYITGANYCKGVEEMFFALFDNMPNVGLIDDRILCVHGMITLELTKQLLQDGWDVAAKQYETMNKQLRWNVPSEQVEFCERNSRRQYGNRLGPKAIKAAMERLGVEFVISGSQMRRNGVKRIGDLPVVTIFSSSGIRKAVNSPLGALLFIDPEKNAIMPIFLVNIDDKIQTQEEFDEKLAAGWKIDNKEKTRQ